MNFQCSPRIKKNKVLQQNKYNIKQFDTEGNEIPVKKGKKCKSADLEFLPIPIKS